MRSAAILERGWEPKHPSWASLSSVIDSLSSNSGLVDKHRAVFLWVSATDSLMGRSSSSSDNLRKPHVHCLYCSYGASTILLQFRLGNGMVRWIEDWLSWWAHRAEYLFSKPIHNSELGGAVGTVDGSAVTQRHLRLEKRAERNVFKIQWQFGTDWLKSSLMEKDKGLLETPAEHVKGRHMWGPVLGSPVKERRGCNECSECSKGPWRWWRNWYICHTRRGLGC